MRTWDLYRDAVAVAPRVPQKPKRQIRFSLNISVGETYTNEEYNRQPGQHTGFTNLTELAMIARELQVIKAQMLVHPEAKSPVPNVKAMQLPRRKKMVRKHTCESVVAAY